MPPRAFCTSMNWACAMIVVLLRSVDEPGPAARPRRRQTGGGGAARGGPPPERDFDPRVVFLVPSVRYPRRGQPALSEFPPGRGITRDMTGSDGAHELRHRMAQVGRLRDRRS